MKGFYGRFDSVYLHQRTFDFFTFFALRNLENHHNSATEERFR